MKQNKGGHVTSVKTNSKVRKRSEEETKEIKKPRQSSSETMADKAHESHTLTEEARAIMSQLHISTIENTVAETIETRMQTWLDSKNYQENQEKLVDRFVAKCSDLIESSNKKTAVKIEKLEDVTSDHDKRLTELEKMADDYEQMKRNHNIVVRGLKPNTDPKSGVIAMVTVGLGIHITEKDIKFSAKLTLKNEREDSESMKVAFYDRHLRDEIYARRTKLKGSNVFISEDLTPKKSSLAFETRQYARTHANVTTWTYEGAVFVKDNAEAKPRVIHRTDDLALVNPAKAANPENIRQF